MIITTVYTPEYRFYAQRLVQSCMEFGIPCFADAQPSLGSWKKNTTLKLDHLLRVFRAFDTDDILFLDADAEIVRDIRPFFDLVALSHRWMQWGPKKNFVARSRINAAAIWTSASIRELRITVIENAMEVCNADDHCPEEYALSRVLPWECVTPLPQEYCWLIDYYAERPSDRPYIIQHQVNLWMRDRVK